MYQIFRLPDGRVINVTIEIRDTYSAHEIDWRRYTYTFTPEHKSGRYIVCLTDDAELDSEEDKGTWFENPFENGWRPSIYDTQTGQTTSFGEAEDCETAFYHYNNKAYNCVDTIIQHISLDYVLSQLEK